MAGSVYELLYNDLAVTVSYLAAYQQAGRAVYVGSYRENRVVGAELHMLRHPGLQEMLQDIWGDVLCLETRWTMLQHFKQSQYLLTQLNPAQFSLLLFTAFVAEPSHVKPGTIQ